MSTCLLIFAPVCLSIYLYAKLRVLRVENEGLRVQPPPTLERQPALADQEPWLRELPEVKSSWVLSDASNPDWKYDAPYVYGELASWPTGEAHENVLNQPGDEDWAGQILEALGYKAASPAVLLQFLRKRSTRSLAVGHIAISVGLARTSFETEPESTPPPFSP
jgi:hypothetical protein